MKNLTINVGEYVRTKEGLIFKVININDFREPSMRYGIEANYFDDVKFIGDEYLEKVGFKSSPNIIDLIEVGDYVNGRIVEWVGDNFVAFGRLDYTYEKDIKSIVTKEQFESMEYKVGE